MNQILYVIDFSHIIIHSTEVPKKKNPQSLPKIRLVNPRDGHYPAPALPQSDCRPIRIGESGFFQVWNGDRTTIKRIISNKNYRRLQDPSPIINRVGESGIFSGMGRRSHYKKKSYWQQELSATVRSVANNYYQRPISTTNLN